MRIFITGASGHIGTAVTTELLAAGHQVTGLARSERSAAVIAALGADVLHGDLTHLDALRSAAAAADGVIHLAFGDVSTDMTAAVRADLRAIEAMGDALHGTGKPFIGTNATLTLSFLGGITDRQATEADVLAAGPRADAENAVIALAERGVRSAVVRIPPIVHRSSDRAGLLPALISTARQSGVVGVVGEGANRWPAVHEEDVAGLYRLALEHAPAGQRLHAVAEEQVTFRDLADLIANRLDLPVRAVESTHFGALAFFAALDNPVSGAATRQLLNWIPAHETLAHDLRRDGYWIARSELLEA